MRVYYPCTAVSRKDGCRIPIKILLLKGTEWCKEDKLCVDLSILIGRNDWKVFCFELEGMVDLHRTEKFRMELFLTSRTWLAVGYIV